MAAELFRKTLAVNPNDPASHNNLGMVLMKRGHYAEALTQYQQTLAVSPDFAPAHYNLGLAYAELGQFDEAIKQYREALKLEPDNPEVHNNLGNALQARGSLNEAIQEFEDAIRLKPNNAVAHYNLVVPSAEIDGTTPVALPPRDRAGFQLPASPLATGPAVGRNRPVGCGDRGR